MNSWPRGPKNIQIGGSSKKHPNLKNWMFWENHWNVTKLENLSYRSNVENLLMSIGWLLIWWKENNTGHTIWKLLSRKPNITECQAFPVPKMSRPYQDIHVNSPLKRDQNTNLSCFGSGWGLVVFVYLHSNINEIDQLCISVRSLSPSQTESHV